MNSYNVSTHPTGCKVITAAYVGGGIPISDLAALVGGWSRDHARYQDDDEGKADPLTIDSELPKRIPLAIFVIGRTTQLQAMRAQFNLPAIPCTSPTSSPPTLTSPASHNPTPVGP